MSAPPIAVIVPLYNKARYIGRCLDAVFAQTHSDFELIVVNDGSTDGSEQIAAARAANQRRMTLVHQTNAGPGAARNHGMRLAHAEWAAFIDGDDAWEPDFLAQSLEILRKQPDLLGLNWGMRVYPQDTTTEARWKSRGIPAGRFEVTPETPAATIIGILANTLPTSCILKREAALAAGGYYDKFRCLFSEDAHLYLKLLLRGPLYFDARPLALRYEDASELAINLRGVRPIEPFLLDPEDLYAACPVALRPLLDRVLAARALKTASVYGFYGQSGKARELMRRFVRPADWRSPLMASALAGCTPAGGWVGALARQLAKGNPT